jgi:tungstate transport system substrate-binding protein
VKAIAKLKKVTSGARLHRPARIKGTNDVAKAFQTIKEKQAPFISRGDRSGTHLAELALWNKDAGVDIEKDKGAWYKSIGQGMDPA